MKVAFYGSSLLSSYWNGVPPITGALAALARRGYDITFYEPDAFGRQQHRTSSRRAGRQPGLSATLQGVTAVSPKPVRQMLSSRRAASVYSMTSFSPVF